MILTKVSITQEEFYHANQSWINELCKPREHVRADIKVELKHVTKEMIQLLKDNDRNLFDMWAAQYGTDDMKSWAAQEPATKITVTQKHKAIPTKTHDILGKIASRIDNIADVLNDNPNARAKQLKQIAREIAHYRNIQDEMNANFGDMANSAVRRLHNLVAKIGYLDNDIMVQAIKTEKGTLETAARTNLLEKDIMPPDMTETNPNQAIQIGAFSDDDSESDRPQQPSRKAPACPEWPSLWENGIRTASYKQDLQKMKDLLEKHMGVDSDDLRKWVHLDALVGELDNHAYPHRLIADLTTLYGSKILTTVIRAEPMEQKHMAEAGEAADEAQEVFNELQKQDKRSELRRKINSLFQ
ncbi:Fc.00g013420.m01.CDS01 [Cosmosporella sp. VM-42]